LPLGDLGGQKKLAGWPGSGWAPGRIVLLCVP
jgi:hypothetical protein